MATKTSFKQQCPSCEAMVPVKDSNLIGRKIDCPQCKYRFVVEEPEAGLDDDDEKPKKKKGKKEDDVKAKTGPRADDEDEGDEDEDGGKSKSKEGGGSKSLVIGGALAGVLVILLGVGAFVMMGGDSAQKASPKPGGLVAIAPQTPVNPLASPTGVDPNLAPGGVAPGAVPSNLVEMTDLLPGDAEQVYDLNIKDFLRSPVGRAAFAPGAFRDQSVQEKIGIFLSHIDRVLLASSSKREGAFTVIRTNQPIPLETLQSKWDFKPAKDSPIQGMPYFVSDTIGSKLGMAAPGNKAPAREVAACLRDKQTLVLASVEEMKEFLKVKGQPPVKQAVAPATPTTPPSSTTAAPILFPPSTFFRTINPDLKVALDQVEAKQPVLISLAADLKLDGAAKNKTMMMNTNPLAAGMLQQLGQSELTQAGLSLQMTDGLAITVYLKCKSEKAADKIAMQAKMGLMSLPALAAANQNSTYAVPVELKWLSNAANPTTGLPGTPGVPGGFPPAGVPNPAFPGAAPGLAGPIPGSEILDENAPRCVIDVNQERESVLMTATIFWNEKQMASLENEFLLGFVVLRGWMDMRAGAPHWVELAQAIGGLPKMNPNEPYFPRGAFDRPLPHTRLGRPWAPTQRVSWMAQLLPALGYEDLYRGIKFDQSWRDYDNRGIAAAIIPEFLDASYPDASFFAKVSDLAFPVGATHFVGVAGVGLDAAEYAANDPSVAKLRGVFGYNRTTKVSDITDGTSNTIAALEVPWTFQRPWMAGGGSTVQGVPESKSIQPFISKQLGGKKGTLALFADNSVRFIADNIADDAFKGLCTIAGGEKENISADAPKVKPEDLKIEKKEGSFSLPPFQFTPPNLNMPPPTAPQRRFIMPRGPIGMPPGRFGQPPGRAAPGAAPIRGGQPSAGD